ncbi:hypothetical protein AB0F43_31720 [Kribbella sp. NPDC023972]|uniref:hypothetical protein n=1 Tax=Kribbella sp. NPDC023972 TaxID=3154795 RepID=UPI00340F7A54
MCHQHPVAEPIDTLEDAAFDAAAYGADRRLMLDLLMRVLLDLDSPEAVAELRSYLNTRAPAVSATRNELLAELPGSVPAPGADVLQPPAGPGRGQVR